jgi:mannose-6-phosphate isomerase-like protein (cupin superfamily)
MAADVAQPGAERMMSDTVLQPGDGPAWWVLGDLYTFKLSGEPGTPLAVVETTTFPGNGPPPHIHHREDEMLFVLEGTYAVLLGERELHIAAGSFVHIPRGTLHTYRNPGSDPARMLVTLTPAGFERFWREIGEPATQRTTPPSIDAAAVRRVLAAAPHFGLEVKEPGA